jgi:predicted dehydrogenase
MKIGIIGYGSIGQRHTDNLKRLGHNPMIYDIDKSKNGYLLPYLLDTADAFVIASPSERHHFHLMMALETGKPVFVEKPIATTLADFHDLSNSGRLSQIFVGYNLRFLPAVIQAKNYLVQNDIQPIWARFTCAQLNEKPAYLRDGVILNWSHEIDLALHLLGPAKLLTSHTELVKGHDVLTVLVLQHMNGCISTIHLDYLTAPQVRGFVIASGRKNLISDLEAGSLLIEAKGQMTQMSVSDEDFDQCYVAEMEYFIHFCEHRENHGCSAGEALQVLRICLDARKNAGLEI